MDELGTNPTDKLTGYENLLIENDVEPPSVLEFWRWAYSDLLSNTARGVLAEYLVAISLGLDDQIREEWAPYDLKTEVGLRIEVKSSAFLQSWTQRGYSKISFDIRETRAWQTDTGTYSQGIRRQADIYVFAILVHKDQETVNPLDVSQWNFYVLSAEVLDKTVGSQKSLGLNALRSLCKPVGFADLKSAINAANYRRN